MEHKMYSLVLLRDDKHILLGFKKRGFGVNKWNGFGGKLDPGETLTQCALRELEEESSLTADDMTRVGRLLFEFEDEPNMMEVHVFTSTSWSGQPCETEEMRPQWFALEEIPFKEMWLDDQYWMPLFLQKCHFDGYFKYRGSDEILYHQLDKVDNIDAHILNES